MCIRDSAKSKRIAESEIKSEEQASIGCQFFFDQAGKPWFDLLPASEIAGRGLITFAHDRYPDRVGAGADGFLVSARPIDSDEGVKA